MTTRVKPFISRAGGKSLLLKHLLPRIPTEGVECYVEAFGGGAAVLLARPRIKRTVEVYNDIDAELVNAFRQVRAHGPEVVRCLMGKVNSRRDFNETRDGTWQDRTELRRGVDWIWMNRISFGGQGSEFGVTKSKTAGGAAKRVNEAPADMIIGAHARLVGVIVEELPWQRLVKNYDGPNTFFFFDPPYFGKTQKSYKGWTREELGELAEAILSLKGRWLLTFGDHPGVRDFFPGCRITAVDRQRRLSKTANTTRYPELIIESAAR